MSDWIGVTERKPAAWISGGKRQTVAVIVAGKMDDRKTCAIGAWKGDHWWVDSASEDIRKMEVTHWMAFALPMDSSGSGE